MSVSHEEHTETVLNEMRREELEAVASLFVTAWKASAPLSGRVTVPDGRVDLQWLHTNISPSLVVTHEHSTPDITEDGTLLELPVATKYVVGVSGEPVHFTPLWIAQKEYDIAPERKIARELFDLGDEDVADEFVTGFADEKSGRLALQERRAKLLATKEELHYRRDSDVIDGRHESVKAQLRTALHLRELLEIVREVEPRQIAKVVVSREIELDD